MTRKPDEKPPWNPKTDRDVAWLSDWTISEWHRMWTPTQEEVRAEIARDNDPAARRVIQKLLDEQLPGAHIAQAVHIDNDPEKFVRLMRNPDQARYAFQMLRPEPKQRPGRPRKADDGHLLTWPSEVVDEIHAIWERNFGKHQRTSDNPPSVYDIAALIVCGESGVHVDPDALRDYRRKHGKPR